MWARWAPPLERSRLMTLSGSGASFGAFLALPLTGYICQTLGWPAVFYICGEQNDSQTHTKWILIAVAINMGLYRLSAAQYCFLILSKKVVHFFLNTLFLVTFWILDNSAFCELKWLILQVAWVVSGQCFGLFLHPMTLVHIAESAKRREITSLTPLDPRLNTICLHSLSCDLHYTFLNPHFTFSTVQLKKVEK